MIQLYIGIILIGVSLNVDSMTWNENHLNYDNKNVPYRCMKRNGEMGICQEFHKCKTAQKMMTSNPHTTFFFTRCGYYGQIETICCGDVNELLHSNTVHSLSDDKMNIHEKKCQEYMEDKRRMDTYVYNTRGCFLPQCRNGVCNYTIACSYGYNRSDLDEFPHMAEIGWEIKKNKRISWSCGGSLISNNFVLTVAHCLYHSDENLTSSEPNFVRLGDYKKIVIEIEKVISHPEFSATGKNDIGLIKLSYAIESSLTIRPACLSNLQNIEGMTLTAIGYGKTRNETRTDFLQKVFIDVFFKHECDRNHPSNTKRGGLIASQFCAGDRMGIRDTCTGDSGGPLQLFKDEALSVYQIVGMTSYGKKCGDTIGAIYTRVSHYIDWIESIVWSSEYNLKKSIKSINNRIVTINNY